MHENATRNRNMDLKNLMFWILEKYEVKISMASCFYPGDLEICIGDREFCSVSRRLLDNLGELAYS